MPKYIITRNMHLVFTKTELRHNGGPEWSSKLYDAEVFSFKSPELDDLCIKFAYLNPGDLFQVLDAETMAVKFSVRWCN